VELRAAQRRDGVGDHVGVVFAGDPRQFRDLGLPDAGARLAVDEAEHCGLVALDGRLDGRGGERLAPLGVDGDDLAARPLGHLAHPLPEVAVRRHEDRLAGFDEVREGGLHRRRSRPADRERVLVVGPEEVPEPRLDVLHHVEVAVVEISHDRVREGAVHPGVDVARTRAHERSVRRDVLVDGERIAHTQRFDGGG
jgi:hypothetical protein